MKRRIVVRPHSEFVADVARHVEWLSSRERDDVITRLEQDIGAARELLARFPSVGTAERVAGKQSLRRLILRHVPYVVWFTYDASRNMVTLVRLFHARQRRPMED